VGGARAVITPLAAFDGDGRPQYVAAGDDLGVRWPDPAPSRSRTSSMRAARSSPAMAGSGSLLAAAAPSSLPVAAASGWTR